MKKKSWIDRLTVVITGASSGIGRELTKMLILNDDCTVIGIGRNEEKLKDLKNSLGDKCEQFEYMTFDVSVEKNWQEFAEYLKVSNKSINVVINNAGMLPPFANFDNLSNYSRDFALKENFKEPEQKKKSWLKMLSKNAEEETKPQVSQCFDLSRVINTNLISVIYSCYYLCPLIEESETKAIINVSSSAGLCPLPGISTYSASKAGVKNFTEVLSLEKNYYVGLICPGFTKTDIFRSQTRNYDSKLINMIATPLDKMTKKIYRGILKKKRRMVLGMDAKFMDFMYRFFPKSGTKFLRFVLKKSKIDLFKDVFCK